jgi:hypothetical protein
MGAENYRNYYWQGKTNAGRKTYLSAILSTINSCKNEQSPV